MSRIEVADSFVLALSLLFFADTGGVLFWFLLAAALHEAGHWLALRLAGGALVQLRLTAAGAVMRYRLGDFPLRRTAIALAGPCTSFLAAWGAAKAGAYAFAGANALLGAFNLLPIAPLDGGTAAACLLGRFRGAARALSALCAAALFAAGLWLLVRGYGAALAAMGAFLLYAQKNLQK